MGKRSSVGVSAKTNSELVSHHLRNLLPLLRVHAHALQEDRVLRRRPPSHPRRHRLGAQSRAFRRHRAKNNAVSSLVLSPALPTELGAILFALVRSSTGQRGGARLRGPGAFAGSAWPQPGCLLPLVQPVWHQAAGRRTQASAHVRLVGGRCCFVCPSVAALSRRRSPFVGIPSPEDESRPQAIPCNSTRVCSVAVLI